MVANNGLNINFENNPTAYFLKQISSESFEGILENIRSVSEVDHIYLKIYYKMYCSFMEKSGEAYLDFKKIFFENIKLFVNKDLRDLHFCLISGVNEVINPEIVLQKEKLSVFDSMIRLNILKESDGTISEHIFISYISLSFQVFDIDRINRFSEKFIEALNEDTRSNASKYVKALNLFLEGKYEDSLDVISQIDPNYFVMKLYLRYHRGRCIYMIKDYDLFLSDYDSVKHFLKKNSKLNIRLKDRLEKYYYFLNFLFKLRTNFNKYDAALFKKEIKDYYKHENSWFLIEINNLVNTSKISL